ncbi:MAG TPA: hypothetical protein VJS37_19940 [Terriglobales bacterium]|nr:hypothetical protein [Terriglobales bacterium]
MKLFRHSESQFRATPQPCAKNAWHHVGLLAALAIVVQASPPVYGQGTVAVSVVNMIPKSLSGESRTDSEPNLAVNPSNTRQIAASAFTPDPRGGPNAPIYISTDGGQSWMLNLIVPGSAGDPDGFGTNDITLRFGSSNVLYAAILEEDVSAGPTTGGQFDILRTNDFTSAKTMTRVMSRRGVDMPYVEVISVGGKDRVYVGNNDLHAAGGRTATVDRSLDAANAPNPAGFASQRIETRSTCGRDAPSIRPAVHERGTIYAAFFRWTECRQNQFPFVGDVVVVRDDNFAAGTATFTALREPPPPGGDGMPGMRVVTSVPVPFGRPLLGNQRVGSRISIAVDPNDRQRVYLAWGHGGPDPESYALHLRRSIDGGANWSNDLRLIPQATNPSLAINSSGKVGFLYQQLTGTAPNQRWATHLERTDDAFATHTDLVLHDAADNVGDDSGAGPLGDYNQLLAVGRDFYGVFSGNNTPDKTNFPHGVKYQRNANFTTGKLLATNNVREVDPSIDPFFFKVRESRGPR